MSSTRWQKKAALPPDICAFDGFFAIVFAAFVKLRRAGEKPIHLSQTQVERNCPQLFVNAFANQSAQIKVLRFEG